jgi:hypothetical protein
MNNDPGAAFSNPPGRISPAKRLKPPADVHLGVRLTAIVSRPWCIGGLFSPLVDRQVVVAAMDREPPHRLVALCPANFTSINGANHLASRRFFSFQLSVHLRRSPVFGCRRASRIHPPGYTLARRNATTEN